MARQETGQVNGTSIIHKLNIRLSNWVWQCRIFPGTMKWPESREKEWKDVEKYTQTCRQNYGECDWEYSGDNERKNTEWKFGGSKWVDGKHRNNLGLLIRNSSQCFWMFLTSLYHRFGCLLAFLMLWTQNGLFLMVIFLLNSIKPALGGYWQIRMSTRKSRKDVVKKILKLW